MVLEKQAKEIIFKVIQFMEYEAKNGLSIPLERVMERVRKTLNHCNENKEEGNQVETGEATTFSHPARKRRKPCPVTAVDTDMADFYRNHIYRYYKQQNECQL